MKNNSVNITKGKKQRVTAFIDPILVRRLKARGALEGLTFSEVVERALDEYAPKIEKDNNQNIHLKFTGTPIIHKELEFKEGDWYYKDSYTGFFQSWGREVVWYNKKPFWTQIYGGGMNKEF